MSALVTGRLDRRITFRRPTFIQNEFGEAEASWEDVTTVWAEVKPLRGREYFAAQQVNSEVTTRFRIRYLSGVDTRWRILHDGLEYDIFSVAEIGRREGLEILGAAKEERDT